MACTAPMTVVATAGATEFYSVGTTLSNGTVLNSSLKLTSDTAGVLQKIHIHQLGMGSTHDDRRTCSATA